MKFYCFHSESSLIELSQVMHNGVLNKVPLIKLQAVRASCCIFTCDTREVVH